MKTGDLVKAKVSQVEEGFALLQYHGMEALLSQLETTWNAGPVDVRKFVNVGSEISVLVTAIDKERFSCSLKRIEANPWDAPPDVGSTHFSPVTFVTEYSYFIRICWYCDALLHVKDALSSHIAGDNVLVKVKDVNTEKQRIVLVETK